MPDHFKKILNRAHLEDKNFNDVVLHLERKVQLNGVSAPDEATLIPLNSVNAVAPEEQEQQPRGYCIHCGRYGHFKAKCRRLKKERHYETKTKNADINQNDARKPQFETCGKMLKTENCWDGANAANDPRRKRREVTSPTNKINKQPLPTPPTQPKNSNHWIKGRREGVHH